jgi:hypothetical protein
MNWGVELELGLQTCGVDPWLIDRLIGMGFAGKTGSREGKAPANVGLQGLQPVQVCHSGRKVTYQSLLQAPSGCISPAEVPPGCHCPGPQRPKLQAT